MDLIERLRRHAPQLVAETLQRLPAEVREQLQQMGLGKNGLPDPGAGDPELSPLAQRVTAGRRTPPAPGTPGHSVSIDKAWHGLHYLLCGAPEPAPGPLGQAVFGGTEIGLEGELHARFDAAAMTQMGIYPGVWEPDDHDWLIDAFHTVRDFYTAASEAEKAVVILLE